VALDSITLRRVIANDAPVVPTPLVRAALAGGVPPSRWSRVVGWLRPDQPDEALARLRGAARAQCVESARPWTVAGPLLTGLALDRVMGVGGVRRVEQRALDRAGMPHTVLAVDSSRTRRMARSHELRDDTVFVAASSAEHAGTPIIPNGAGTIGDLARWALLHIDDGRVDGQSRLPAGVLREARALQGARSVDAFGDPPKSIAEIALCRTQPPPDLRDDRWVTSRRNGTPAYGLVGAYDARQITLWIAPERRLGVVVATNGGVGDGMAWVLSRLVLDLDAGRVDAWRDADDRIWFYVLGALAMQRAQSRPWQPFEPRPFDRPVDPYAGRYIHPVFRDLRVSADTASRLQLRWGALAGALEPHPFDPGKLTVSVGSERLVVTSALDPHSGRIRALSIDSVTFVRTGRD
jgi:hypothetical protein